jgi:hypothetical protein
MILQIFKGAGFNVVTMLLPSNTLSGNGLIHISRQGVGREEVFISHLDNLYKAVWPLSVICKKIVTN